MTKTINREDLKRDLRESITQAKQKRKEAQAKKGQKFLVDYIEGKIAGYEFVLWELQENII